MRWITLAVLWLATSAPAATIELTPAGPGGLQGARDAARARRADGPVTVVLRAGTYVLDAPLELGPDDSDTTWRASADEHVRIAGGPVLPQEAFAPVSEGKILARLPVEARGHVLQADLSRFGNLPLGQFPDSFRGAPAAPELFFNDQRMTLARWPNDGWATIAGIVEGGSVPRYGDESGRGGVFQYSGDAPARWNPDAGVWLQGYWCYDWYDEAIRVKSIDPAQRRITLAAPALYGIRQGNPSPRRFRALNLLEELDAPGEFYIDRAARLLYFWPPGPIDDARITLSTLNEPLVIVKDADRVTLRGLTFEASLGDAIHVTGGRGIRIERCTVRNTRQMAIRVNGGTDHHIDRCEIHDTGSGGLALEGGDRRTLMPAGHQVTNCRVHHFSRHQQTAAYGIILGGVGNRAAHNLIHDAPHQAVLINGNDHVFELNIVRDVVTETDDAGAVYKGRNPSCRGNVIRHNLFRDIGSPMGHGTGAIYFDDGDGGDVVFGNIFIRCGDPGGGAFGTVFSHGGHGIRADNNLFVDCKRALGSAPWNDQLWKETIDGGHDCHFQTKLLQEVDITRPPYTTRYPELAGFMDPKPGEPRNSHAKDNVLVRCGNVSTGNWIVDPQRTWVTSDDPGFVNAANGNYTLREDAEVFRRLPDFAPIPFARIGPR